MIRIDGMEIDQHDTQWGVVVKVNEDTIGIDLAETEDEARLLSDGAGLPLVCREVFTTAWAEAPAA